MKWTDNENIQDSDFLCVLNKPETFRQKVEILQSVHFPNELKYFRYKHDQSKISTL